MPISVFFERVSEDSLMGEKIYIEKNAFKFDKELNIIKLSIYLKVQLLK